MFFCVSSVFCQLIPSAHTSPCSFFTPTAQSVCNFSVSFPTRNEAFCPMHYLPGTWHKVWHVWKLGKHLQRICAWMKGRNTPGINLSGPKSRAIYHCPNAGLVYGSVFLVTKIIFTKFKWEDLVKILALFWSARKQKIGLILTLYKRVPSPPTLDFSFNCGINVL